MNVNIFVSIVAVAALLLGVTIGIVSYKIHNHIISKRLVKNAKEVIDGKRKNSIKIDGKEYDATNFRLKDKDGENILVDLKGGGEIQDGKTRKTKSLEEESKLEEVEHISSPRQDSDSNGEEKRPTRTGTPRGRKLRRTIRRGRRYF